MNKYSNRLQKLERQLFQSGALNFTRGLPPSAELYLIGGAVRDCLLGLPDSGDYDFVIRNVLAKDLEKILSKYGRVNFVGQHFGIFKFTPKNGQQLMVNDQQSIINGQPLDIALPRTERSLGTGAYRDFKIQSDPNLAIETDLSRRDFTINAISWKIPTIKQYNNITIKQPLLIDPFNGIADIKNKLIRAVGRPVDRFREDHSRLLRALRLACQLNFAIEPKTWSALKKIMPRINDLHQNQTRIVPYEVIASELLKALTLNPVKALDLFDSSGAIKYLIPEILPMKNCSQPKIFHSEGDVWTHAKLALSLINSSKFKKEFKFSPKVDAELILAVLFHDIGKPKSRRKIAGKVSFYGHDLIGAGLSRNICDRLKLSAAPDFAVKSQNIFLLVAKHTLYLFNKISQLKNSTLVKYFLIDSALGDKLFKLFWLDSMASIPYQQKPNLSDFQSLKKRIADLKKQFKAAQTKPLLNGSEIMRKFHLPPGPKIGRLKAILEEAQLAGSVKTKPDALNFLKNELKN